MPVIVQKYGGSSLATPDMIRDVALQIVERRRQGYQLVVVVSAMGKTTNGLLDLAHEVSSAPSMRELDMLVTAGERISMALVSMSIGALGEKAISFTGSQSGIVTEDSHQGASIVEVRPTRIRAALDGGNIVIVAGYQGVSLKREVTTLGRGGSDTTAVALTAALSAEACEIYSDVDGVYSADPRVCPQARLLRELNYEVMEELSRAGARVLNLSAVKFAQQAGIVLHARKTGDRSGRETVISGRWKSPKSVLAVVGATNCFWSRGASQEVGRIRENFEGERGRCVWFVDSSSHTSMLGTTEDITAERLQDLARDYSNEKLDNIFVDSVSLIGENLPTLGDIKGLLKKYHREILGVYSGEKSLTLLFELGSSSEVVPLLHDAYIDSRCVY
ncbi:MAG: aspartate kinase [Myxococcota bacterium]|nr:aspartate kinase [Myxococcota bacterium]